MQCSYSLARRSNHSYVGASQTPNMQRKRMYFMTDLTGDDRIGALLIKNIVAIQTKPRIYVDNNCESYATKGLFCGRKLK